MSFFVTTCVYFKHFCKMLDHWNDVKGFALIWQKVGLIGLTYTECKLRNWKHDSGDGDTCSCTISQTDQSGGILKTSLSYLNQCMKLISAAFSQQNGIESAFFTNWTYQNMQGKKHQTSAFQITILSNWIIHSIFLPQLSN